MIYNKKIQMKFLSCFKKQKIKRPPDEASKSKFKLEKEKIQLEIQSEIIQKNKTEEEEKKRFFDFKKIAEGYFAKVYKAKDINNKVVAIKKINISKNQRFYELAKKECHLLNTFNSPHIIKIYDAFVKENYLYIVLPFYKVDLFAYIPKVIGKPKKIFQILLGISKGLEYLHNMGIMHGDIKPENIMLNDKQEPILIDFGLSRNFNVISIIKERNCSGTLIFLSPEIIDNSLYTEKADIWALGVIMYMMLFNRAPFNNRPNMEKKEIFQNIKYMEQFYPVQWEINGELIMRDYELYNKSIVRLNKGMLRKTHEDRPNIEDIKDNLDMIIIEIEKSRTHSSLKKTHDLMVDHLCKWKTM